MDEQASFEARAVLAPRRARKARLALLVPVVALVAIAWGGLSGDRSDPVPADLAQAHALATFSIAETSLPAATPAAPAQVPTHALGLKVTRLADVQVAGLDRDNVVAVAGWYVPTAITDCPALAAIYKDGALPYVRGDTDKLAFCVRSGLLYASEPELERDPPTTFFEDNRQKNAGLPVIAATMVVGVVAPLELEEVGSGATQVVVLGRFVPREGCGDAARCSRELIVDYVAWPRVA